MKISVFEHQSITFQEGKRFYKKHFTKDIFEAFLSYHDRNPDTPFFDLIHNGVRFKNFVGAIQVGKVTIEVLPKAGKNENTKTWHHVLLNMLKTCNLLQAKQSGMADLKLRANSVLELYFEMFLNEVELLLRQGFIKKYKKKKGQQRSLKGALDFNTHISKNLVHKERFYVSHTVYTRDHLLHQILYEALLVISAITNNSVITDKIKRIKSQFPEVSRLKIKASHFERISESRKHQPYNKAISIAKLILLNYRPDIKAGRKNLLAIMFDMNMLWEEYVIRILKKNKPNGWEVMGQVSTLFWERKTIRPDILLRHEGQSFIIDTKWKVIHSDKPSDADLKQMFVYNHHWRSRRSFLLYPNAGDQSSKPGIFALDLREDVSHSCQLAFVNVINDSGLNENLASEIFSFLKD
jgi:5-methylcytosine-specific restriction enzyme subunit McrC